MTLDEAIKHCEEKAEEIRKANEEMPTDCKLSEDLCECAREQEQLAGWLKELKEFKEAQKGDLISRDALKKAIMELSNDNPSYYYTGYFLDREKVLDEIDNAPTITDHSVEIAQKSIELGRRVGRTEKAIESQKPQGEWIFNGFCFSSTRYKCSKCGYLTLVKISPCPNCGADMREQI